MIGAADVPTPGPAWPVTAVAWEGATLAVRATLLLGLAAVAAPLIGRRRAAARHLVWAAALAGVVALPLLRAAGARWTPRTFTAWVGSAEHAAHGGGVRFAPPNAGPGRGGRQAGVLAPTGGSGVLDAAAAGCVLLWGAGVAVGLAALLRETAVRRRFTRGSPADGMAADSHAAARAAVGTSARTLAVQLGVRRAVRLVWGPPGMTPMTWGVRRPVLLLPADVAAWPPRERDTVLRHELAHVRRGDAGWALVAELACAAFWWHPGVWLARAARLRWQERAADALVVASGAERHAYAAALVAATRLLLHTRGATGRGPAAAPAFAVHAGLAERLGALTAPGFAADPCTRRHRTVILGGAVAGALALGALDRAVTRPITPRVRTGQGAAEAGSTAGGFVAADSTLVVLVPAAADAAGLRAAARVLRRSAVAAVYTTDDRDARRTAELLHLLAGGSLIPYDRVGMTDDAFAGVLVENAVGANPRRAVAVVVESALVRPVFRRAAAAAGVNTGPTGNPGGRADGVLVLTVAPQTDALVRARY